MVVNRYVALGDSFTEGVGDDDPSRPNGVRGWADRVAEQLAVGNPGFRYANLAIRGRLMDQVLDEQLQPAIDLEPDLVTIYAGGNDIMRKGIDIDAMIGRYDAALSRLRATGATVVVFTAYDTGWAPVFRLLRGRIAVYNELLREVAENRGLTVLDYWRLRGYDDMRMWSFDRLHMSPAGHARMAAEVLDVLGLPHAIDVPALGPAPTIDDATRRREDREWVRSFLLPWFSRRIKGTSSGDGLTAKWPQPVGVEEFAGDTAAGDPAAAARS